jgi:hypothetical protein
MQNANKHATGILHEGHQLVSEVAHLLLNVGVAYSALEGAEATSQDLDVAVASGERFLRTLPETLSDTHSALAKVHVDLARILLSRAHDQYGAHAHEDAAEAASRAQASYAAALRIYRLRCGQHHPLDSQVAQCCLTCAKLEGRMRRLP